MILPLIIALAVALAAAAGVLIYQGVTTKRSALVARHSESVEALAADKGGAVTPLELSRALGISVREADRILRSLVDDKRFTMGIDERAGTLRYWYPARAQAVAEEKGTYTFAKPGARASMAPRTTIPPAKTNAQ